MKFLHLLQGISMTGQLKVKYNLVQHGGTLTNLMVWKNKLIRYQILVN